MNTHADDRHNHPSPETADRSEDAEAATNMLAHHRDPSLATSGTDLAGNAHGRAKRVAWIRPTDLSAYAAPLVGRGIDLQAELIRRARRTPVIATRTIRRTVPLPGSSTPLSVSRMEAPPL